MVESILSSQMKRTGNILRNGASNQIVEYNRRFESIKDLYDSFLVNLFVSDFSYEKAYEIARRFFGSNKVEFAAVDGTGYTRPLFDMIIFFGGSYAARGAIEFRKDKPPKVEYATRFVEQGQGIAYPSTLEPTRISLVKPLTDESIANNSAIASWIIQILANRGANIFEPELVKEVIARNLDNQLSGEKKNYRAEIEQPTAVENKL